jgi:hypothetical protein
MYIAAEMEIQIHMGLISGRQQENCSPRTDSFPRLGRRQIVFSWLEEGTYGKQLGNAWAGWPLGLEQGWYPRGRARWRVLNNLRAIQRPVGKSWPWPGCTKFENSYFA